jgi:hypothetical protein
LLIAYGGAFLYEALDYASNLYLLLILLAVCAIAPLREPSVLWPRRLGQLTITAMYLGAAIGKLEPHFLSGQVLEDLLFHYWGHYPAWIGVRNVALFRALAALTLLTELGLAVALWQPRTARLAIWVGIAFHVTIDVLMPVRIFSYLVIASYVLFLPAPTLVHAYAWLDRHARPELRAALCLLIALLFDLRDPFVALQPSAAAAALIAFAGYSFVRFLSRRRVTHDASDERSPPPGVLRNAGPWLVVGYVALQTFAIAKPAFGYSKFFSWRMFSEVLTLRIDPQVLRAGRWQHAIFPNVQQRWSQEAFTYQWTSWSEEQFYLQGYARWLDREYRLAGQVRVAVAYTLFHGAEQRAIMGSNVFAPSSTREQSYEQR